MHALIIEDEYLTAQLIEDQLRDLGFTSFALAMDEQEAVTAARDCARTSLVRPCDLERIEDAVQQICAEKLCQSYTSGSAARGARRSVPIHSKAVRMAICVRA